MDRRAEGDNHARKEQRARAAAKNVSTKFVVRFHSYTSLLRREPWSRLTLREEGQVDLWETPNGLDADSSLLRHLAFLWQYAELRTSTLGRCDVARLDRTPVIRLPRDRKSVV